MLVDEGVNLVQHALQDPDLLHSFLHLACIWMVVRLSICLSALLSILSVYSLSVFYLFLSA